MKIAFNIVNINASRISNEGRILAIWDKIKNKEPNIVCIQEIDIFSARNIFGRKYQVYVNFDLTAKTNIGIVTLVDKDLKVIDTIIGNYGRIIGIKVNNIQVWNIYPLSGTGYKKEREIFFKRNFM